LQEKKAEDIKRIKEETKKGIDTQIKEKYIRERVNRLEDRLYVGKLKQNAEQLAELHKIKKNNEKEQKKEYREFLDSQLQLKRMKQDHDTLVRRGEIPPMLRAGRPFPDDYADHYVSSVIPTNKHCHERAKQLSIIDNWLQKTKIDEEHMSLYNVKVRDPPIRRDDNPNKSTIY